MAIEILTQDRGPAKGMQGLTPFGRLLALYTFRWGHRELLYETMIPRMRGKKPSTPERLFERHARRLRRTRRSGTAAIVERAHFDMAQQGRKLARALQPVIPRDEYAIITAGEASGQIATSLSLLIDLRRRTRRILLATLRMYGSFVMYLVLMIGTLVFMAKEALPSLQLLMEVSRNPPTPSQQRLISVAQWATGHGPAYLGLVLVALALGVTSSLFFLTGRVRVFLERFPPWSTYRGLQGYVWLSTFVILVRSGRSETKVLEQQAEHASPWLRERLDRLAVLMGQHARLLPVALDESGFLFPSPDMIDDIDAKWTGDGDSYDGLLETNAIWADEIEKTAIRRARAVELVCILVVFFLVAELNKQLFDFMPTHF
ncbi:pilus biosynthesis protein PilR [Asaia krungthepensis]|uniref:Type II secretion system protein n=1 Tax=Asaia krungthepensis NRIC 0535 TaxID=1307925 RepID=A0ABQ0Q4M8_9PROT|nr:pilus biosynthesis protein PilR [Asaia krungthepensis]GBQ91198.1 type II secretion system protein [Asaia krungthepensis NRIC 0535]